MLKIEIKIVVMRIAQVNRGNSTGNIVPTAPNHANEAHTLHNVANNQQYAVQ